MENKPNRAYKIMVVDDDPSTVRLLTGLLKNHGYETMSAADGLEALAKIKKENPDLILLDVMMPEVNGYDVCYQLRFNEDFKKTPIILVTARDQELNRFIGERVNIDYIHKPIDSKLLLSKIQHYCP